jgi:hypothetical protein
MENGTLTLGKETLRFDADAQQIFYAFNEKNETRLRSGELDNFPGFAAH